MTSTHSSSSVEDLRQLLDSELSRPSRFRQVALLLASVAMTVVVGSLWITEPGLPVRTQIAFGLMSAMGLSWAGFAAWVLTTRRTLLGRDSVIAARMGSFFTSAFIAGALALGYVSGEASAYAAAAMGLVLLAGAVALLVRSQRRVAFLTSRRDALERELGRSLR